MIKVDGSSTVFPITAAIAKEFQKTQTDKVQVTVGVSGTGGGFEKFCAGESDISNASCPILTAEMAACNNAKVRYIELPIAFDALTNGNWFQSLVLETVLTTFAHPPKILFLYGSLRDRSYSRLVAEVARIIEGFGAETRFFDPRELKRIYKVDIKDKAIAQNSPIATRLTTKNSAINIIHPSWREY